MRRLRRLWTIPVAVALAGACGPIGPAAASPQPGQGATVVGWQGGDVMTAAQVYLVRAVAAPGDAPSPADYGPGELGAGAPSLADALSLLGDPAVTGWWTSEYSLPARGELVAAPRYAGALTVVDPALTAPGELPLAVVESELADLAATGAIPSGPDAVVTLLARGDQTPVEGPANNTDFCALHGRTLGPPVVHFIVLPDLATRPSCVDSDPGAPAGSAVLESEAGTLYHEIVESVTDPGTDGPAWVTGAQDQTELADVCSGRPPVPVTAPSGATYDLPLILSDAVRDCLGPGPSATLAVGGEDGGGRWVALRGAGGAVAGATLDVVVPGVGIAASVTTDASGQVVVPDVGPDEAVYYAGSPTLGGAWISLPAAATTE